MTLRTLNRMARDADAKRDAPKLSQAQLHAIDRAWVRLAISVRLVGIPLCLPAKGRKECQTYAKVFDAQIANDSQKGRGDDVGRACASRVGGNRIGGGADFAIGDGSSGNRTPVRIGTATDRNTSAKIQRRLCGSSVMRY